MSEADALQFHGTNEVRWGRRRLLYFSGCDYFRLARNPRIHRAARAALRQHGLNVAASRRTTGNHPIYGQLEAALARFFKSEGALIFPDGYMAPLAAAQAHAGEFGQVYLDELAHGALVDAAGMLGVPIHRFRHRDPEDLRQQLDKAPAGARPLVMTDGLFAHDGSVAPVAAYLKHLPRTGMVLLDDAHGAGVLGRHGRGTPEWAEVDDDRVLQCVTLSKAFGVYGGAVLARQSVREKIRERSRLFTGTTPLSPLLAGAALEALKILARESARRGRLQAHTHQVRQQLAAAGWPIEFTPGPIIRLPALESAESDRLKTALLAAGIYPPFLKYGAASANGFFRLVISSEHTPAQLKRLVAALRPPA